MIGWALVSLVGVVMLAVGVERLPTPADLIVGGSLLILLGVAGNQTRGE